MFKVINLLLLAALAFIVALFCVDLFTRHFWQMVVDALWLVAVLFVLFGVYNIRKLAIKK